MSAFDDKWLYVRVGMSKQEVYAIIGKPDNAPDIGHMTVCGYDPEEFEFWNRDGKAYQCTFAYSSLKKKKIGGNEDNRPVPTGPPPKEGCFIATVCYGSYEHPAVLEFRRFRDAYLREMMFGRAFIRIYYRVSPIIAQFLTLRPRLARVIRYYFLQPTHNALVRFNRDQTK